MKTFVSKISTFVCFTLLLFSVTFWTACKKDKTTYGTVTVTNEAGTVQKAATVVLAAPSASGQKSFTGKTDGTGVVKFEIDLPGIWDVTVTADTLYGTGVLRLDEPGKKDEIKVIVR